MDRYRRFLGRQYCRIAIGIGCTLGLLAFASNVAAQIPDLPGWQLSWHDEFDGATVDTTNWNLLNLQNSQNNEKQYYRPEQASIVDGDLRITASNVPLANKAYRSARLESKMTFGPSGRYEARIDIPTGKGMWPAFWAYPNSGTPWPQGGEIDVIENKGSQPTVVSSAFHYQKDPGPCCANWHYVTQNYSTTSGGNPVNFQSGFHKYAVDWEPTQLRFYVDDQLSYTVNQDTAAMSNANFLTPKNIILNLAVGGNFDGDPDASTTFPQYMDVDYVRIWQHQTGLIGDYNKDNVVDAADYTVWRDTMGQSGIGLAADGSGNGTVDQSDYDMWLSHFGASGSGSGADATTAVPEPTSICLAAIGLVMLGWQRRYSRR